MAFNFPTMDVEVVGVKFQPTPYTTTKLEGQEITLLHLLQAIYGILSQNTSGTFQEKALTALKGNWIKPCNTIQTYLAVVQMDASKTSMDETPIHFVISIKTVRSRSWLTYLMSQRVVFQDGLAPIE